MTMVETRAVTGGVDTHADKHVAAALDPVGGLLGVEEFPVSPAGYARLLGWLGGFGTVALVGIEGTGSAGGCLKRDPGRQTDIRTAQSGVSRIGGQTGTQPDPTPAPTKTHGSRAGSSIRILPAESGA